MTMTQIGNAGEALVLSEFARCGVPVYLPTGEGGAADLVADFAGGLQRVQVKTTGLDGVSHTFQLGCRTRHGWLSYPAGALDWWALVCLPRRSVVLTPWREQEKNCTVNYGGEKYKSGGLSFDEYALERIVNTAG